MDERTLQAASAALEKDWLKLATLKELELLRLSGQRPTLFENKDDGELRILFHPSMGLEPMTAGEKAQGELSANAAELVFRRTRLRTRLALPAHDCAARRPNDDCTCLTATLDELSEEELKQSDKATLLAAARTRHIRSARRWRRKPTETAAVEPRPTPERAPDPLTETSTRPALKQRVRRDQGPPHLLSYAAFKRSKSGPSIHGITNRKF